MECCGWTIAGPDPCWGCKLRRRSDWRTEYFTTLYVAFLAEYLETLRPSPQEISWRDLDLYEVFAAARNEYLAAREKNSGQAKNKPRL